MIDKRKFDDKNHRKDNKENKEFLVNAIFRKFNNFSTLKQPEKGGKDLLNVFSSLN